MENEYSYLIGFLILKVKYPDEKFRPSKFIDELWKDKLIETKEYIKICKAICKKLNTHYKFIHREPLSFEKEDEYLYTKTKEAFSKEFNYNRFELLNYFPSHYDEFNCHNNIEPEFGYTKVYYYDLIGKTHIFKFKNNKLNLKELKLLIQEKINVPHYNFNVKKHSGYGNCYDIDNFDNKLVYIKYILRGC